MNSSCNYDTMLFHQLANRRTSGFTVFLWQSERNKQRLDFLYKYLLPGSRILLRYSYCSLGYLSSLCTTFSCSCVKYSNINREVSYFLKNRRQTVSHDGLLTDTNIAIDLYQLLKVSENSISNSWFLLRCDSGSSCSSKLCNWTPPLTQSDSHNQTWNVEFGFSFAEVFVLCSRRRWWRRSNLRLRRLVEQSSNESEHLLSVFCVSQLVVTWVMIITYS